jgi:hypothetical protein
MSTEFSKEELKMPEERFGTVAPEEHSSFLAVFLGILILTLMLILAGLYMWSQDLQEKQAPQIQAPTALRPTPEENNEPESNNAEAEVETTAALSTSDEISALEADIQASTIETLDSDVPAIEAELMSNN